MTVSPQILYVALVCYWSTDPVEQLINFRKEGGPIFRASMEWLHVREMILADGEMTDKGRAWIEHILSTPLPVQSWTVPEREMM